MRTLSPSTEGTPPGANRDLPEILERLLGEGHRFDFYQAMTLLETWLGEDAVRGETRPGRQERIQIRPHPALVFPATDVREVARTEGGNIRLAVTFMGLYGVDSPLPYSFYQAIVTETEEGEVLRDFLDIFNQRLYAYFYHSWKKYRPGLHFTRAKANDHAKTFLNLAGLGTDAALATLEVPHLELAAFAGRLGGVVRNADGLQAMLAGFLDELPVRVLENVPRWVPVRERAGLGQRVSIATSLGRNTTVGCHLYDVSGKFRVVLGPLTLPQYEALLPGGEQAHSVQTLVRIYTPDYLAYDVELLLKTTEVTGLRLGGRRAQMGRNAWVGRPAEEVISEVVTYESWAPVASDTST